MDGQDRYPSVILHSFVAKPDALLRRPVVDEPQVRRIRRTGWLLGGIFLLLALLVAIELLARAAPAPISLAIALAVAALAALTIVNQRQIRALAEQRRRETESINRILQVLSRSTSAEAILSAIVEEVRAATGADHSVVARLRPNSRVIEATLVSASPSAPPATTTLPASLLEPGPRRGRDAAGAYVAIPVERDPAAPPVAPARAPAAPARPPVAPARPSADPDVRQVVSRIAAAVGSAFGLSNTLEAPLVTSSGIVGALVLSRRTADPWPSGSVRILDDAAHEASVALERAYAHAAAEVAASTDPLTGLPNRRYFDRLSVALGTGRRRGDLPGILVIDIDHFERLNDSHGHGLGDEVLRVVAERLAMAVRRDDVPIRYGGEEFLVVLRSATVEQATDVAERIRHAVRAADLRPLGIAATVTVSVGVAVAGPAPASIAQLVERADAAMYDAKRAGRDRVVVAPQVRAAVGAGR